MYSYATPIHVLPASSESGIGTGHAPPARLMHVSYGYIQEILPMPDPYPKSLSDYGKPLGIPSVRLTVSSETPPNEMSAMLVCRFDSYVV